jgi:hypothetical protein
MIFPHPDPLPEGEGEELPLQLSPFFLMHPTQSFDLIRLLFVPKNPLQN